MGEERRNQALLRLGNVFLNFIFFAQQKPRLRRQGRGLLQLELRSGARVAYVLPAKQSSAKSSVSIAQSSGTSLIV